MSQTELPPWLRRMSEREERLARDLAEAALDGLASGALNEEPRLSDAAALAEYDRAAQLFIEKVESGRAQSRETYGDLKRIMERRRAAR